MGCYNNNNNNNTTLPFSFVFCSCREQIRDVRHEYHFTSIRNLSNKLSSGLYMLSIDVPTWIDLDPGGVTYGGDSDAQVSKEFFES